MALNIENREVEQLLERLVILTGETKTEAVRKALEERHRRLSLKYDAQHREIRLRAFLEDDVWSRIPVELLGKRLTREHEETILGYGEAGV
jgi:antitoxin VapB